MNLNGNMGLHNGRGRFPVNIESFMVGSNMVNDKIARLFYVDWCGHCQKVKPEFEKLQKTHHGKNGVSVEMINCENPKNDKEKQLIQNENIKGYPHIVLHCNDNLVKDSGPRTHEELVRWVEEHDC